MKKISSFLLFCAFFVSQAWAQALPPELLHYADMVICNGKVLTADKDTPDFTVAEAVALRDGRILSVGRCTELLRLAGLATLKVDLKGKTLIPGFIATNSDDVFAAAHLYKLTQIGLRLIDGGDRVRAASKDAFIAKIKEFVGKANAGEPIFITFVKVIDTMTWSLTRADLDPLSPNNPLAVTTDFDAVVNTKVLELAFAKGLNPGHFGVVKDGRGQPTGQLFGQAAGFVQWALRPYPEEDFEKLLQETMKLQGVQARAGVTTLAGHANGLDTTIFNVLYHRGQLYARIRLAMDFLRANPHADQFLRRVGLLVDYGLGDAVKIIGANQLPGDAGINNAYSISTHDPMNLVPDLVKGDRFPTGVNIWMGQHWTGKGSIRELTAKEKSETERQTIIDARRYGWNFHSVHNMGSRAAEEQLLALEEAVKGQKLMVKELFRPNAFDHNLYWDSISIELAKRAPEPVRFGVATREVLHPRIEQGREVIREKLGERIQIMQPVKSLREQGIKVHVEINPETMYSSDRALWLIEKLVTRKDDKGRPFAPDQALDRKTALLMATRWVAEFIGEEKDLGSIEPGKFADLVVLGGDYLNVPADDIHKMPVLMTLIGGKIVYIDSKFAEELGPDYPRALHPALRKNP